MALVSSLVFPMELYSFGVLKPGTCSLVLSRDIQKQLPQLDFYPTVLRPYLILTMELYVSTMRDEYNLYTPIASNGE
ncbi:unnamed protein product [Rhizoctonia solani]|uniref:Uncharacterized protein n=1 Tax=Rhizoctonia solani TaxID=456999 RepID=A0A8H3CBF1_9AGAM|nr:unnamed protein product [Rhizoctonia solani]